MRRSMSQTNVRDVASLPFFFIVTFPTRQVIVRPCLISLRLSPSEVVRAAELYSSAMQRRPHPLGCNSPRLLRRMSASLSTLSSISFLSFESTENHLLLAPSLVLVLVVGQIPLSPTSSHPIFFAASVPRPPSSPKPPSICPTESPTPSLRLSLPSIPPPMWTLLPLRSWCRSSSSSRLTYRGSTSGLWPSRRPTSPISALS